MENREIPYLSAQVNKDKEKREQQKTLKSNLNISFRISVKAAYIHLKSVGKEKIEKAIKPHQQFHAVFA